MFGINDNNQNTSTQPAAGAPADSGQALPPSPFMDNSTDAPAPSEPSANTSAPSLPTEPPAADKPAPQNEDALVNLKEQALNNLAPLVNHLDQTPEEKFKTTMMLIQASDNSALVKEAYEAANQISDEKVRAQALLDVINEINYFTQKDSGKDKV
jgi:hypothetical protein